MDFTELLQKRHSIRNYMNKAVPLELIQSILEDSTLAPSAGNEQPWKFLVIRNKQMINTISEEGKRSMLERIASNPNDYAKKYEKMLQKEGFHIFYNAPVVIYILGDKKHKNLFVDCALVACYLMMSATAKGLGTCWVNFGTEIQNPALREEMGLLDTHEIVAPIALGYPERIPEIPKRKEPQIIKIIE